MRSVWLFIILLAEMMTFFLFSSPVLAQICFRGKPLPECRSFFVTEAGLSIRLDSHSQSESRSLTFEVGYMVNRGTSSALGATVFLRGVDPVSGIGVRPRYRYWLTKESSLDISPGILLRSLCEGYERVVPSFSGQIAINPTEFVGFTTQIDVIRFKHKTTDIAWYLGAKLDSYFGVGGMLGFFALVILVAATW